MPEPTPKPDQATSLLNHANLATYFRSKDGEACASIPATLDSRTVVPLRSAAFRDWLIAEYYKQSQAAPSPSAFRAALRTLEARARYDDFPTQQVTHRLSHEGDPFLPSKIFLDLANPPGEILEITSRGWTLTDTNFKTAFRQATTTLPLPNPQPATTSSQPPATFTELSKLFRIPASQHATVLAWLASALRPTAPYPILVLDGPAGSGKSVLARALRALIDPSTVPIHRLPPRARDLLQLALRNWVLVFDLVHRVPYKISEALCAISSGDALEITQPDLREPLVIQIARPMILVAPHDETQRAFAPPRTLANRTLTVHLDHIACPRPEAVIWSAFEALRPAVLSSLSDAVSTAMCRIRDIDLGNVPRFPDCAAWTLAAAPCLGLDAAAVIGAFAAPGSVWAGSDPLREAMHALLEPEGAWTGEADHLLHQLRARVPFAALPSTPKGLSQTLPSVSGIRISRSRNQQGRRVLTIARILDASQEKDVREGHTITTSLS